MNRFNEILNEINTRKPVVQFKDCIDNIWEAAEIHVKETIDNGNA